MVGSQDPDGVDPDQIKSSADLLVRLFDGIEEQADPSGLPRPLLGLRIPTRLGELDVLTQGLQRGTLVVLAGSTGMGKTAMALNLARNISLESKIPVLYGAFDSSPEALLVRLLSSICKVESRRIASSRLSQNEWPELGEAIAAVGAAPLFFLGPTDDLKLAIRERFSEPQLQECGSPGVVILDQLQLMPEYRVAQHQGLSVFVQDLRQLAKDLNLCLILLCQTSPHSELRDDQRPRFNYLPGVDAMQAYAQIIAFLHRPEYWDPASAPRAQAELTFYKNAENPLGKVELRFEPQFSRFSSQAGHP